MIKVSDNALSIYQDLQVKHHYHYIIFNLTDDEIVCESSIEKASREELPNYEAFVAALISSGEPRYGVIDYQSKIVFITWNPDNAPIRMKMLYTSALNTFKQNLTGVNKFILATAQDQLDEMSIKNSLMS